MNINPHLHVSTKAPQVVRVVQNEFYVCGGHKNRFWAHPGIYGPVKRNG
jgi:uncharacterized Zn-finger protein